MLDLKQDMRICFSYNLDDPRVATQGSHHGNLQLTTVPVVEIVTLEDLVQPL